MKIDPRINQIRTKFDSIELRLYFIKAGRNTMIDAGMPESPEYAIVPALKGLGLTLADIDLILLTHGHFDHSGGVAEVKAASNAPILLHKNDIIYLQDHQRCFEEYFVAAIKAIRGSEFLKEEEAAFVKRAGAEVTVDKQLEDNDLIELDDGIELRVICLPGHSPGSVGFYWEKKEVLFSGDSLPGLHLDGGKLPVIWDLSAYKKSLERLQKIPIQFLLCGHPFRGLNLPAKSIRQGEEVRQYLQSCREFANRIEEVVRHVATHASGKPFARVANQIIAELPKEMGFTQPIQNQHLFTAMTIFGAVTKVAGDQREINKTG